MGFRIPDGDEIDEFPTLEKQDAFRLVSDAEDDFHAIEGLSQALMDLSS